MKKCDYCAKEISYYDQYCNEECEKKALDFYTLREKFSKVFAAINIICIFGIPVGLFLASIDAAIGFSISSFSFMILGATVAVLPFPVENMISKMKIKKAIFVTRIIGAVFIAIGFIMFMIRFILF